MVCETRLVAGKTRDLKGDAWKPAFARNDGPLGPNFQVLDFESLVLNRTVDDSSVARICTFVARSDY